MPKGVGYKGERAKGISTDARPKKKKKVVKKKKRK